MATPENLRSAFENRMKQDIPNPQSEFDPLDLELVKDNQYLSRVLSHVDGDLKKATNLLWNIMAWRKTVEANKINESNIRMDYIKEGIFFPGGRDKDGKIIFIVKNKLYDRSQKDFKEIQRVIIYWLERIEREEDGDRKITFFFDMEGCTLGNVDMELYKYFMSLFHLYYPDLINYIVIYEVPWVLNAVFTVVKALMPAKGAKKMKICTKDSLNTVAPPENALQCWGGKDLCTFEFVPKKY